MSDINVITVDLNKYEHRFYEPDEEGFEWLMDDLQAILDNPCYARANCEGDITNTTLDLCEKLLIEKDAELLKSAKLPAYQIEWHTSLIDPFGEAFWGNVLEKAKKSVKDDSCLAHFTPQLREIIEKEKESKDFKTYLKDSDHKEYYSHQLKKKYSV